LQKDRTDTILIFCYVQLIFMYNWCLCKSEFRKLL